MKPRFSQGKRSYYERCRLIPKVAIEHKKEKIIKLNKFQIEKWDHIIYLLACSHVELMKITFHRTTLICSQYHPLSTSMFDASISPDIPKPHKILCVVPVGNVGSREVFFVIALKVLKVLKENLSGCFL